MGDWREIPLNRKVYANTGPFDTPLEEAFFHYHNYMRMMLRRGGLDPSSRDRMLWWAERIRKLKGDHDPKALVPGD